MDKKRLKNLIIIIAIISYGIYVIYCEISANRIEKNGKYTVAKVTDFKMNFRNGYTVYYEYSVNEKLYSESMLVSKDYNNILNYRFYAKYDPEKPQNSKILLDKQALSKYWDAPADGWIKIPE